MTSSINNKTRKKILKVPWSITILYQGFWIDFRINFHHKGTACMRWEHRVQYGVPEPYGYMRDMGYGGTCEWYATLLSELQYEPLVIEKIKKSLTPKQIADVCELTMNHKFAYLRRYVL